MPYAFAQRVQKEVPMLFWASQGYVERTGLNMSCLKSHAHDAISHDNLYHTVLGALAVSNAVYDRDLDVLAQCRSALPASLSRTDCFLSPIGVLSSNHVRHRP